MDCATSPVDESDADLYTPRRYGVLLVCEGAPENTRCWSVLRFLSQKLTNPRAYAFLPAWLWHPLVYAVVLPRILRDQQSMYRSTWSWVRRRCPDEGHEAPVKPSHEGSANVVALAEQLGCLLETVLRSTLSAERAISVQVEVGFYHRKGSVEAALERLQLHRCHREVSHTASGASVPVASNTLLVLPLYPHHKAEFTGSVWDAVMRSVYFQCHHNIPNVHFLRSYAHKEAFLETWHRHIRRYIGQHGSPDWLFLVFHGTQQYVAANGDTYRDEYTHTADELRERLSTPWSARSLAQTSDGKAFFRGSLSPSRITTAFLGQGSERLREPRLERVFLSIIRQLKSISANNSVKSSPMTSVMNREEVDAMVGEGSAYSTPHLSRTPLPFEMAPTAFVVCPGEALDDTATVWKLQESLFPVVKRLGWRDVQYIPALNDTAEHADVLASVLEPHLV